MSVDTLTHRNDYEGTGTVGPFPYTFRVLDAEHLRVVRRDTDGDEELLALGSDYAVTGVGRETGGSVTLTSILPDEWVLTIRRNVPLLQETEFGPGPFLPEIHEDAFDYARWVDQQQQDEIDRAFKLPETVDPGVVSPILPYPEPGKFIRWSDDGTALVGATVGDGDIEIPELEQIDLPPGRTTADVSTYLANNAFFNPLDFGAVGDGVADDTAEVQACLDAASVAKAIAYFPPGTYMVTPILVKSNTMILCAPGVIFKAKPGYATNDRLMNITNVSNVTILANGAAVQMLKAEYTALVTPGEQRHGVFITGTSSDIRIYDLRSIDSGGDGFYIGSGGGASVPQRIRLSGVVADNNRRNGLSITGGVDVVVDGVFKNTTGTAPQAGVCIEPNSGTDLIQRVVVRPVTMSNDGSGVIVVPLHLGDAAGNYMTVSIENHESYDDAKDNGSEAGARFDSSLVPTNPIRGVVRYSTGRINRCNNAGLVIGRYCWTNCPTLEVEDVRVTEPGTTATASSFGAAGVALYTGLGVGEIQNVHLRNVYCEDLRGTKKMYVAFWLGGSGGPTVRDCSMVDCDGTGWLLANSGPFSTFGTLDNVQVQGGTDGSALYEFAIGNYTVQRYAGILLTQTGSGVLTLPAAATYTGMEWEFANLYGTTLQVRPAAGDTIQHYGVYASNDIVSRTQGDYIRLRSMGGTKWMPVEVIGTWSPLTGTSAQRNRPWSPLGAITADVGDANATVVLGLNDQIVRYGSTRTAHRTVTVDTSKALPGDKVRVIVESVASGFNVITPVKTIPSWTSAWVEMMWNGAGLIMTGYGILNGLETQRTLEQIELHYATNGFGTVNPVANNTWVDTFTPDQQGTYLVTAYATNAGNTYDLQCYVVHDGTNVWVTGVTKGSNVTTPQIAAGKLQYKQTGGGSTLVLRWVAVRFF